MWEKKDSRPNLAEEPMEPNRSFGGVEPESPKGQVNIGPTVKVKGELSGNEDLIVEGQVEGRIDMKDHNLFVGQKSRIQAEVHAKIVTIEGDVTGDVYAYEKLIIKQSGKLRGNIVAPRIVLEDGARFKGSVDMEKKMDSRLPLTEARKPVEVVDEIKN